MTEDVERALAEILRAEDPVAALAERAQDDVTLAELAARISPDGLRMAALLVLKLRFERLVRGSREAERESEEHPREFARAFRRYHREVPPLAVFPPDEARAWEEWRARRPQ